jgi:signal transduction histidine kinase
VDLQPGLPEVTADHKQVRQILNNLVMNALQAMPRGGTLTLALRGASSTARVLVEDTGEGIPRDRLARIFDSFYTSKPTGTGLGLALCRKLAEQQGAKITVESEEGKGTTFVAAFPFAGPSG